MVNRKRLILFVAALVVVSVAAAPLAGRPVSLAGIVAAAVMNALIVLAAASYVVRAAFLLLAVYGVYWLARQWLRRRTPAS